MKKTPTVCVALLATLSTLVSTTAADRFGIKVYTPQRTMDPVVLDGKLQEKAWRNAPVVGGFTLYGKPDAANPQTFFRIVYDHDALYVGIVCDEPDMKHFAPVTQVRDSMGVFRGEAIELFIDPEHSHSTYYQIAVNAAASIYDSKGQDPAWSAAIEAAAAPADTNWSMEIKIPWKDLGVKAENGTLMGFNLCRDRQIGGKQWTNWARVMTGFHDPVRFAHLVLSPTPRQLAQLTPEFRKGDRQGPIEIYTIEGISGLSYKAMAEHAVERLDQTLQKLENAASRETRETTREALNQLLDEYRTMMQPIRDKIDAGTELDGQQWTRMDLDINELKQNLDDAVWKARLKALLSEI